MSNKKKFNYKEGLHWMIDNPEKYLEDQYGNLYTWEDVFMFLRLNTNHWEIAMKLDAKLQFAINDTY